MAVVRHVKGNANQISVAELGRGLGAFGEVSVSQLRPTAIWNFAYNVNPEQVTETSTGGGSITTTDGKAVLATGAQINSSAQIETINALRYVPGFGGLVRFTALFTTGVAGSTQIVGIGDDQDGFFFGYNGTEFGVLRRSAGVDTWVAQSSWNEDKFDGSAGSTSGMTLDPTKGNVFQIRYQWLGFGHVTFYIEEHTTGGFLPCHKLHYPNNNTVPTIQNPTLPLMARVGNTTNNTNIQLQTASALAAVEGAIDSILSIHHTLDANNTNVIAERPLLTIRNTTSFQSKTNRVRVRGDFLTAATDGAQAAFVRGKVNGTITSTSAYTVFDSTSSVVQYNTTSTGITGGTLAFSIPMARQAQQIVNLDPWDVVLNPGDHLTITGQSSAKQAIYVALTWEESF